MIEKEQIELVRFFNRKAGDIDDMEIIVALCFMEAFILLVQKDLCDNIFEPKEFRKLFRVIAWGSFYIISNVATYVWELPAAFNALIFSISLVFVLNLLYSGNIKKKVLIAVFLFILGMISELLVYLAGNVLGFNMSEALLLGEERLICAVVSKLLWFIGIKVLLLLIKMHQKASIKIIDWIEVFFVPVSSMFIVVFLSEQYSGKFHWLRIIVTCLVLIINLFTFHLYGEVQEKVFYQAEKEFLIQQTKSYALQLQKTSDMWTCMQKYRHDLKQTYMLIQTYLEQGAYDKLKKYYTDSINMLKEDEGIVKTGNVCFDTIINYKSMLAKEAGVVVHPKVIVPYDLVLNEQDLCSMLGNLFDNAIEAAKQVDHEERIIELKVKMSGTNMYLEIGNPYKGERIRKGKDFLTTKTSEKEHGIGLKIVRDIVEKHKGKLEIETNDDYFKVMILVYDMDA